MNPNSPHAPLDPDSPDSPALPYGAADYPKPSELPIPVGGSSPGVNRGPGQDADFLPEGEIVTRHDPYSAGERLPSPLEESDNREPEEFSDSWITLKVKAALVVHPDVSALSIEVVTLHGVVTLNGTADTPHESQEATSVAEGIKGVKRVDNLLRINNRH